MPSVYACPACSTNFKTANPLPAGKAVKCPKCAAEVVPIEKGAVAASAVPATAGAKVASAASSGIKPAAGSAGGVATKPSPSNSGQAAPAVRPVQESDNTHAPQTVAKITCSSCKAILKPATPVAVGKT